MRRVARMRREGRDGRMREKGKESEEVRKKV